MKTAITRSESLTNLPVKERDPRTGLAEDIRQTWMKKTKKTASLTGSHVCEFSNLMLKPKNDQPHGTSICAEPVVIESAPFLLCGNTWVIKVYPYGVDEDSEYLSVRLQNKSDDIINAYYALAIRRSDSIDNEQRLNMWVDPDIDSLHFQPYGHEDSAWGVDDFIPLRDLYTPELGYMDIFSSYETDSPSGNEEKDSVESNLRANKTNEPQLSAESKAEVRPESSVDIQCEVFVFRNANGDRLFDRLYIEVQMMVFGEVSLKAHPLTQAIEQKNASEEQLIELADKDLDLIRQATKGGGPSLSELSALQDTIISKLCPSPPSNDKERKPPSSTRELLGNFVASRPNSSSKVKK
jgi:hypothetical protein